MMRGWYGPGDGWMMGGSYSWMGLIAMILQLLFWLAIIFLAVRLIKSYLGRENTPSKPEDRAMTILRERYAKGEIDQEEFHTRKSELEK
ncbi:MAG: hypothetical protein GX434_09720 [Peptococcaceae bacterium]|nr:hypothetical protein [Peptococcaceae bacterium]